MAGSAEGVLRVRFIVSLEKLSRGVVFCGGECGILCGCMHVHISQVQPVSFMGDVCASFTSTAAVVRFNFRLKELTAVGIDCIQSCSPHAPAIRHPHGFQVLLRRQPGLEWCCLAHARFVCVKTFFLSRLAAVTCSGIPQATA